MMITLIIAAGIGMFIACKITRPVSNLNMAVSAISRGKWDQRVGYRVEEAMQFSIEEILPTDSLQKIQMVIEEELTAEAAGNSDPDRSRIIEYQQYRKDGSIIPDKLREVLDG